MGYTRELLYVFAAPLSSISSKFENPGPAKSLTNCGNHGFFFPEAALPALTLAI